jgi:hypothetical protein
MAKAPTLPKIYSRFPSPFNFHECNGEEQSIRMNLLVIIRLYYSRQSLIDAGSEFAFMYGDEILARTNIAISLQFIERR